MNELEIKLKEKGWTDENIAELNSMIKEGQKFKSKKILFLDSIIYWVVLFAALIGNFVISIILIPFMLALQGIRLYVIIFVIGIAFGALFDLLIRNIERIQKKDIIIAGLFLPALALINVSLMVKFANFIQEILKVGIKHDPIIISIVYVIGFVLPYMLKSLILVSRLGIQEVKGKL